MHSHRIRNLLAPFQAFKMRLLSFSRLCLPSYTAQHNTTQNIPSYFIVDSFLFRQFLCGQQQKKRQKVDFFSLVCFLFVSCYRFSCCIKHFSIPFSFSNERRLCDYDCDDMESSYKNLYAYLVPRTWNRLRVFQSQNCTIAVREFFCSQNLHNMHFACKQFQLWHATRMPRDGVNELGISECINGSAQKKRVSSFPLSERQQP